MAQLKAISHFKKVSATGTNPRAGMKRETLEWTYEGISTQEVQEGKIDPAKLVAFTNAMIESFGRKKIAEHGDDWGFVPSGITLDAAYLDMVSEVSKSRLVTKESLQKLGEFYKAEAVRVLGVSLPAANAGGNIIANRFKDVAGKNDVLEVMEARLLSLVEQCDEEVILPFADLIEALMGEITGLKAIQISADAL